MTIAICDHDPLSREHTLALVQDLLHQKQLPQTVFPCDSGAALLDAACKNGGFDLYLLETQLPDISGIQVAAQLRQMGFSGSIVYITASQEFALDAFRVQAAGYLLKPLSRQELLGVTEGALAALELRQEPQLLVKTAGGHILLPYRQILYGELVKKTVVYHLLSGSRVQSTSIRTPFSQAVQPLLEDPHFLLCGSVHVVNLRHICQLSKEELVLRTGQRLYIGKRAGGKVRPVWLKYLQSQTTR